MLTFRSADRVTSQQRPEILAPLVGNTIERDSPLFFYTCQRRDVSSLEFHRFVLLCEMVVFSVYLRRTGPFRREEEVEERTTDSTLCVYLPCAPSTAACRVGIDHFTVETTYAFSLGQAFRRILDQCLSNFSLSQMTKEAHWNFKG